MSKYLRDESFYDDLYDLGTIDECLRTREFWDKRNELLKGGQVMVRRLGSDFHLYFIKGERYREKRSTLNGWMLEARKKDGYLAKAEEPKGVYCLKCQGVMKVIFKDLSELRGSPLRVLFFFECIECGKMKGVFDDGQEYVSKGGTLSKVELDQWAKEDLQWEERKKLDQERLRQYRAEFCLSEMDGEEYILSSDRLSEFTNNLKETSLKKADPAYAEAMKLNKLTIIELEKFLKGILENEKYIRLSFDKPIIDKHVIVPLTVQDENTARDENTSTRTFQRILKKALNDTNWRLMSEGVNYRLGYLFCKLKGYEQEADLIQIIKSRKSKS